MSDVLCSTAGFVTLLELTVQTHLLKQTVPLLGMPAIKKVVSNSILAAPLLTDFGIWRLESVSASWMTANVVNAVLFIHWNTDWRLRMRYVIPLSAAHAPIV